MHSEPSVARLRQLPEPPQLPPSEAFSYADCGVRLRRNAASLTHGRLLDAVYIRFISERLPFRTGNLNIAGMALAYLHSELTAVAKIAAR